MRACALRRGRRGAGAQHTARMLVASGSVRASWHPPCQAVWTAAQPWAPPTLHTPSAATSCAGWLLRNSGQLLLQQVQWLAGVNRDGGTAGGAGSDVVPCRCSRGGTAGAWWHVARQRGCCRPVLLPRPPLGVAAASSLTSLLLCLAAVLGGEALPTPLCMLWLLACFADLKLHWPRCARSLPPLLGRARRLPGRVLQVRATVFQASEAGCATGRGAPLSSSRQSPALGWGHVQGGGWA